MSDLALVQQFLNDETGLATVSTVQNDGRVLSSVANCGVISNPTTATDCVALVSVGSAARLQHIRHGSEVTIAIRRGWNWVAVTGKAQLIGPDDRVDAIDSEGLRLLLREIYIAAGGHHDDFEEYDKVMASEKRVVVCVEVEQIRGNT